jgi:hypothetical protein
LVDPDRLGDVLERLLAQVLKCGLDLSPGLPVRVARQADAAGFGQALQAGRDVDAIAMNVLALNDHVAHINADAELERFVPLAHTSLPDQCAGYRVHDATELNQNSVTHQLDHTAMMVGN